MKSPFPGMDPFLERHWGDVHATLIVYARDLLQPRLPDDLLARIEQRVFLQLDYRVDLDPPLSPEDAAWATALLQAEGGS